MNEPYHRVSQNNGEITSTLTGAAIGAGLTGSGLIGARAHYNNTDKRLTNQIDKSRTRIENGLKDLSTTGEAYRKLQGMDASQVSPADLKKSKAAFTRADDKMDDLNRQREKLLQPGRADQMRDAHLYGKMGGWKKGAAVAGGALLGGAVGYMSN